MEMNFTGFRFLLVEQMIFSATPIVHSKASTKFIVCWFQVQITHSVFNDKRKLFNDSSKCILMLACLISISNKEVYVHSLKDMT